MAKQVTQKQAEKALAQIKKRYKGYWGAGLEEPKLVKNWLWSGDVVPYAILWESGPYDWAVNASFIVKVEGVFAEPYTGWALGIYKD